MQTASNLYIKPPVSPTNQLIPYRRLIFFLFFSFIKHWLKTIQTNWYQYQLPRFDHGKGRQKLCYSRPVFCVSLFVSLPRRILDFVNAVASHVEESQRPSKSRLNRKYASYDTRGWFFRRINLAILLCSPEIILSTVGFFRFFNRENQQAPQFIIYSFSSKCFFPFCLRSAFFHYYYPRDMCTFSHCVHHFFVLARLCPIFFLVPCSCVCLKCTCFYRISSPTLLKTISEKNKTKKDVRKTQTMQEKI